MKSVESINPCESVIQTTYDIVKAHGAELSLGLPSEKVETKEGEGAEFVIQISSI